MQPTTKEKLSAILNTIDSSSSDYMLFHGIAEYVAKGYKFTSYQIFKINEMYEQLGIT